MKEQTIETTQDRMKDPGTGQIKNSKRPKHAAGSPLKIETKGAALRELKAARHADILPVPDGFRDDSAGLRIDRRYSLPPGEVAEVRGVASFENRRAKIQMRRPRGPWPTIGCRGLSLPLHARHTIKGEHNIQLGEVKIIEHVLAMMSALNLDLDFHLTQASFPTFDYCNRPFVDALAGRLTETGPVKRFTVRRAFAGVFDRGYFMLEAPQKNDDERCLTMDHQITYPGEAVGNQRIVAPITPAFFNYICGARTTSFRPETKRIYWLTRLGIARLKYPVTTRNILFADAHKLYNPRGHFDAQPGSARNYEFICHELMDVMAWIKFLEVKYEGKFVGRLTTHFFDHHRQIDAARFVCESREFETSIGIRRL
ncbi:MAG: UDP-3-O-acyl-N-acetylglucosamine deacetylase [bacterium]|nr:UDP-3-O-acyl-N-acetylglucosamine deacetylase [bacterium]